MIATERLACVVLLLAVVAGCAAKVPPPQPPVVGELIELDLGEVTLAETAGASHAIAQPVQVPRKATLRIKGAYEHVDAGPFPVSTDVTRQSRSGIPVKYATGGGVAVKRDDLTCTFTIDVVTPQSDTGEFDLTLYAGKRFIAHGKVIVKD